MVIAEAVSLSLGLNIAAVVGIVLAAALGFYWRGTLKSSQDAASAWKDERDAEKAKGDRLTGELAAAKERVATLDVEVAKYRERTDLRPLMEQQRDFHQATITALAGLGDRFERFEITIASQFAATAQLLETLCERIGACEPLLRNNHVEPASKTPAGKKPKGDPK